MDLTSGIISAAIMPFDESESIDWKTFERYIADVAAGGPRAIAMNMAVSEISSLSEDEQLEVLRRTKSVIGDSCALISGVNVTNGNAAVEQGKRMIDAGAQALVLFPLVPAFLGTVTISMIVDFHEHVAQALSVPLIAFETNLISYPKGAISELSKIKNLVSIKDASFSIEHTTSNVDENSKLDRPIGILTGSDTFVLEALLMGCDGALIGLAATATAALVKMHHLAATRQITEAYEIWDRIAPIARIGWRTPFRDYRVRMKYAMMLQGVIPNMKVRAPFPALNETDKRDIDEAFHKTNFGDTTLLPAGHRSAAVGGG